MAAAGGRPHPDYPSDGIDWRPALAGATLPDRPLFWRFGMRDQRAVRLGRHKFLSIGGNEFLFDIIADPLERANLKLRQPALFEDLKARHAAWNATMLSPTIRSYGFSPAQLPDHFDAVTQQPPPPQQ
jgi:hypothetical protein